MATDIENPVDEESTDDEHTDRTWPNLTAFQRDILWVLKKGGEQQGMAVLRSLEDVYDQELNHPRLYPNLDTLADNGLVTKQRDKGSANAYDITAKGKVELLDKRQWEEGE